MNNRRRTIVLVTQGASVELLERWVSAGRLPAFAQLFARGVHGQLISGPVPYEVPGIVSVVTGRTPGEHGMFSFWSSHERHDEPRVLASNEMLAQPAWRRPELGDLKFGLINVYGTHPPAEINGWVLSYAMEQTLRSSYPGSLMMELAQRGVRYAQDVSTWYSGQARGDFLPKVLEADRHRGLACQYLWEQGADVIFVVLTSLDRTGHHYWQELEPGAPIAEQESAPFQGFAMCDAILGRLLELAGDQATLIALSEQGFGPLRAYVSVNRALARRGFLAYADPGSDSAIDWSHTSAFETAQGTHGIDLNLKGRSSPGRIDAADFERVRSELISLLREVDNPHTGLKLFRSVQRREEVYSGPHVSRAPDIILEPLDERYQPLGHPHWARRVNRAWHSGWHRRQSYFAVCGPSVRQRWAARPGATIDVLPTLFAALGRDVPRDLEGQVWL
jgi:predicted AlkP superfamily phosphohydrolase/phosphomutase